MTDAISTDLQRVLRQLKLSPILATLPERLHLARQQKMPHQDFLELVLADEVSRREAGAVQLRIQKADLDPQETLESWDDTANVRFDRELLAELCTLRFMETGHHALFLGQVGVGKSYLANSIGLIACRRGHSVLMERTDKLLKRLKQGRLDNSHEAELRKLIRVDLLILDDFGIDALDRQESRDLYDLIAERHRAGSIIVTSNRDPDEWLATLSDPIRAQSAIDRLKNNAFDLIIEGESYRERLKPRKGKVSA